MSLLAIAHKSLLSPQRRLGTGIECCAKNCNKTVSDILKSRLFNNNLYCSKVYECRICSSIYHYEFITIVLNLNKKRDAPHGGICKICSKGALGAAFSLDITTDVIDSVQVLWNFNVKQTYQSIGTHITATAILIKSKNTDNYIKKVFVCDFRGLSVLDNVFNVSCMLENIIFKLSLKMSIQGNIIDKKYKILAFDEPKSNKFRMNCFYGNTSEYERNNIAKKLSVLILNKLILLIKEKSCCSVYCAASFSKISDKYKKCVYCDESYSRSDTIKNKFIDRAVKFLLNGNIKNYNKYRWDALSAAGK